MEQAKADRLEEKKKNFSYEERVALHAIFLIRSYRHYAKRAQESDNPKFACMLEKQCFRDSLASMVLEGLIDSYNLAEYTVTAGESTYRGVV